MSCPKTLLKAVTAGRTRQVRLLLDLGASTEEHDDCRQTPLIRTVFLEHDRNRDKIIRMLLKKGAVVSRADVIGRNALAWACLYGRDTDVALILEYADMDLDLNKVDINGQTGLFHAVSSGNAATVKLMVQALVKYDLSVDIPDSNGITPLMHSTRLGHDVCASILIHNGNAKVGLGQVNHESLVRKEKWAVSSLRERANIKKCNAQQRQSQFPPIAKHTAADIPSNTRCRRIRIRQIVDISESDRDSGSSSDEDSFHMTPAQYVLKNKFQSNIPSPNDTSVPVNTPIMKSLQNVPPCRIPPSILRVAYSTIGNISSEDDSEVDSVASTIIEGKHSRPMPVDLSSIFGYKQEQMSSSFRQPAVKIEPKECAKQPLDLLENNPDNGQMPPGKNKGRRDCEKSKWVHLKKSLRLVGAHKNGQLKIAKRAEHVDQSEYNAVQTDKSVTGPKKRAALPNIVTEKKLQSVPLQDNAAPLNKINADKNWNYSEI